MRYTTQEYDTVARAAQAAGLTTTGYVAEAALAAASQVEASSTAPWLDALTELMAARAQVRGIGTNINQAARILNTGGEPPVWLEQALMLAERAVTRLDGAATVVADTVRTHRALPSQRTLGSHSQRKETVP